jgi:hypothetical protein
MPGSAGRITSDWFNICHIMLPRPAFRYSLVLMMLASPPARAADSPDAKPFTSNEGRFTISFPGRPDESTSTLKSPIGDMVLHVFKVARSNDKKDKESYTLVYYDYPAEAIKSTTADKIFDAGQQGGLDELHWKLLKKTDVAKTDKAPASRDLEIEVQGVTNYARMILVENRLYVIMVAPDADRGAAERARAFLDSFKLVSK